MKLSWWSGRRRVAVGAALAVVLAGAGLAGCGSAPSADGSNPSGSSTTLASSPTASAGETSSPTVSTPAPTFDPVPEAARQQTNDGAIAFATFWIDQVNKAFMDPVAGRLSLLCVADSSSCARYEAQFAKLRTQQMHMDRPTLVVQKTSIGIPEVPGGTSVVIDARIVEHNLVDRAGVVQGTAKSELQAIVVNLIWRSGGWAVVSTEGKKL